MTDYELIRAYVQRGDREAIGALIGRYVDVVYGAALRQVRSRQAAEDVTQGVFLLLLQKAQGFGAGVRVGSWLLQATYYACLRAARDLRRREYHERKAAGERSEELAGGEIEDRAWVDAAVRKLREVDREAVVLRFMRGLPLAEVGAELGISEEAARKRVDRAVEKLKGLAPAEAQALGEAGMLMGTVRAPETVLAKVMAQGTSVAAGNAAANCAAWAGAGFVAAKAKIAAAVLIGVMAAGAGAVVLPQVVAGGVPAPRQAMAATAPAAAKAGVARNDLALACWGAIVSEDVAEAVWRQIGGTGDRFAPKAPFVDRDTGREIGRADMGAGSAEAVRGVLRQALEDGEEITWAIWAPAVNRIAGSDGKFSFKGPRREGQVQVTVEGPAGKYRQDGESLVLDVPGGWAAATNVPGMGALGFGYGAADRIRLGEAAVALVQVQGTKQWLVVVHEPWRTANGSSVQHTAESFANPELWVRNGPEVAAKLYADADRVVPRVERINPQGFMKADEVVAQAIDGEAEVRVPFLRDMERNPLIGFGARTGRPVQFMYSRWDGRCLPVQRQTLEAAVFVTDPRVVYGYKDDGTPITLDEQRGFHSLVYVPRGDEQFEREFGAGEYERIGRCEAKVGERIALAEGAVVRIKEIHGVEESGTGPDPLVQARFAIAVEGKATADGEYVVIAVDEQDRPHFPVRYRPLCWSPADGGEAGARARVKDGEYAVRGELKAVEVWRREWKMVTVKGYAREMKVEGK